MKQRIGCMGPLSPGAKRDFSPGVEKTAVKKLARRRMTPEIAIYLESSRRQRA